MAALIYLFITTTLIYALNVEAAVYYFAASGDDSAVTNSANTPWQSIGKLNAIMPTLLPGDSVLFNRGDTFRGQVDLTATGNVSLSASLAFSSYGDSKAAQPIIKGSLLLSSGWTMHSGNIYSVSVTQKVSNVFVDGTAMTLARHPNVGSWFRTGTATMLNVISCANLTEGSGYWTNSTIRVRDSDYTFGSAVITSHVKTADGGELSMASSFYGMKMLVDDPGWGFYMENKLSLLDSAGEWFYDSAAQKLYLWMPGNVNPNGKLVEVAVYNYGISSITKAAQNVVVSNIQFHHQIDSGVVFKTTGINNVVTNCTFAGQISYGVYASNQVNMTVSNGIFSDIWGRAINYFYVKIGTISNNHVSSIGVVPGKGLMGINGAIGINTEMSSTRILIDGNRITNIGYCGIRYDGTYNIVQRNVVDWCMITLSDGGAIYTWGNYSTNHLVQSNVVSNIYANKLTTYNPVGNGIGHCLYFDDWVSNNTVLNNTCYNCLSSAIYIHDSPYNLVMHNVMFNSTNLMILSDQFGEFATHTNNITQNYFLGMSPGQILINENTAFTTTDGFAKYSNNYFCAPFTALPFMAQPNVKVVRYGFSDWVTTKATTGDYMCPFNIPKLVVQSYTTGNLLENWNRANVWGCYSGITGCQVVAVNDTKCSYPNTTTSSCIALKAPTNATVGQSSVTMLANTFGFTFNKTSASEAYELSFVAWSKDPYSFFVEPRSTVDYNGIGDITSVFLTAGDTPIKTVNWIAASEAANAAPARIDFQTKVGQVTLYISQVSIRRCTVVYTDITKTSAMIVNPSSVSVLVSAIQSGIAHYDLTGKKYTFPIKLAPYSSALIVFNGTTDDTSNVLTTSTTTGGSTTLQPGSSSTLSTTTNQQSSGTRAVASMLCVFGLALVLSFI